MTTDRAAKRPVILIVDDEAVIRAVLTARLAAEGYEVDSAEDGEVGVARIAKGFVNVVVSDIKMPRMDGMEVLKRTKASSPDTEVIMMTAYAATDTAINAVRLGAFDYLQKPFEHLDDVVHKVRSALRQQRLELENREHVKKLDEMNKGLKQLLVNRTRDLNLAQEAMESKPSTVRAELARGDALLGEVAGKVREALAALDRRLPALKGIDGKGAEAVAEIEKITAQIRDEVARLG